MNQVRYFSIFIAICVVQLLLDSYLYVSPYVFISILPMAIISLPSKYGNVSALLLAFAAGFMVDFLSSGILGLSSCALLPLALLRNSIYKLIVGDDAAAREDGVTLSRLSTRNCFLVYLSSAVVFSLIFVFVDAAGTRPLWFNLLRTVFSSAASALVMTFLGSFLFRER